MLTTNLRKVGGSVMLTIPPALLEQVELTAGSAVGVAVEDGRIVLVPQARPQYTLAELLAQSDYADAPDADAQWLEMKPVGKELM